MDKNGTSLNSVGCSGELKGRSSLSDNSSENSPVSTEALGMVPQIDLASVSIHESHYEDQAWENDDNDNEVDGNDQEEEEEEDDDDDDDDDDDFGSFDEASFEEFQQPEPQAASSGPTSVFLENPDTVEDEILKILDTVFPGSITEIRNEEENIALNLLPVFSMLSKNPKLNPPNWVKLKIRHNLLIKLGVPINLDELGGAPVLQSASRKTHSRARSIDVGDIDWGHFEIPEFSSLDMTEEMRQELLGSTHQELSRIEEEIMNNTSELYLQSSSEESLDAKLEQMRHDYSLLIRLSSVWQENIRELLSNQEIYESVVQNMVGYSQKLQRNEILDSLKRTKTKKGKRTF